MKKVSKYMIPFRGLKDGIHFFEFNIDNSFFEKLNFFDFGDAKLDLNITLDKKSSILTLKFDFNGFVTKYGANDVLDLEPMMRNVSLVARAFELQMQFSGYFKSQISF